MRSVLIFLLSLFLSSAFGQNNKGPKHPLTNLTCKTCHACDVPTRKDPCLNPCPRAEMITVNQTPEQGPEVEILKELSDKYVPVVFSHRIHSEMAEMSGGCKTCHHYNTIGPIQPCKNCHQISRKRTDISKPILEAAYHRQCITCHREWSHSNDCTSCHALKTSASSELVTSSVEEIKGKTHPKIEEPLKLVFETNYDDGKIVTFYHDEHIKDFGIKCVDCHKQDNCTKCHDKEKATLINESAQDAPIKIEKPESGHHKPCFSCHENDDCNLCHKEKISGPFNHFSATGWALNKFHKQLACTKCHGERKQFVKLNSSCLNCHKDFVAGKFQHEITGLKLDGNHSELECTDCHQKNTFSKPVCSNCHDDKSYPKNKPGTMVKVSLK